MTNNPKKRAALEGFGLTEVESVPLVVGLHEENHRYMEAKRDKMGHILPDDLRTIEAVDEQRHALLFDPKNPELQIPHGDPAAVRSYLRSLPFQYADLAAKKVGPQQVNAFVSQQILQLKERVHSGEDFEKQIFFTANPYKAQPSTAHTLFPGCAYCHEVKPGTNGTPEIAKPVMADRWLLHGRFTHTAHTSIGCNDCHNVHQSKESSDILMPGVKKCAECHHARTAGETTSATAGLKSAPNQVASAECLSCHTFHSAPSVAASLEGISGHSELGKPVPTR